MISHHTPLINNLPLDLLIVRNGISEGSLALRKEREGDPRYLTQDLTNIHASKWRLTRFGQLQAKAAGRWINENFHKPFDIYLTGEYIRSLETASFLNLPGAAWEPSLYLRPRDFGSFADLNRKINESEFKQHMKERARDSFYWAPPNGESIAHLALRTELVIHWIRTHVPSNGTAIIVTHKDVMETIRIRIEAISQLEYPDAIVNCPPNYALNYCSILHYTRRNPITDEIVPKYKWVRVVTPWMGKHYMNSRFNEIIAKDCGNSELITEVSYIPRLFEKKEIKK